MHNNKRCSQFIHDALDIIETEMLVVLSQERKRSESGPLKKKFGDLLSKCMDDSDLEYCTKGAPQRRLLRYGTGVDIIPSEAAETEIRDKKPNIQTYQGSATRKSIRPDQFDRLDKFQG
jgi:hypothetical protein